MSYSAATAYAPATFGRAAVRPAPRMHPTAITTARARNNAAQFVTQTQFAAKPAAMVMAEYAVALVSAGTAIYLALGL